jgi:hypothetical protein
MDVYKVCIALFFIQNRTSLNKNNRLLLYYIFVNRYNIIISSQNCGF